MGEIRLPRHRRGEHPRKALIAKVIPLIALQREGRKKEVKMQKRKININFIFLHNVCSQIRIHVWCLLYVQIDILYIHYINTLHIICISV